MDVVADDAAEPLLTAARVLARHQIHARPARAEDGWIENSGDDGAGKHRSDAEDFHQPPAEFGLPGTRQDPLTVLEDLLPHDAQLSGQHLQTGPRVAGTCSSSDQR